mgnify:CR=1 FL=1
MDATSLFVLAKTSWRVRRSIHLHLDAHVRAKKRVVRSINTLQMIVARDRSGRFRCVFDNVFHRWFFNTRLDNHTRWVLSDGVAGYPKPLGHNAWWCYTCGGTLGCEHLSRL